MAQMNDSPDYLASIKVRLQDGRVRGLGRTAALQLIDRVEALEEENEKLMEWAEKTERALVSWRTLYHGKKERMEDLVKAIDEHLGLGPE